MDGNELQQALARFDATLRQVEAHAGRGLDEHCERTLDAHRRILSHLLDTDTAGLMIEAVKAAKRALRSEEPDAELREIQVVRHSIGRMLAKQPVLVPASAPQESK